MSDAQLAILVAWLVGGFLAVTIAIIGSSYTRTKVLAAKLDEIVEKLDDIAARRLP